MRYQSPVLPVNLDVLPEGMYWAEISAATSKVSMNGKDVISIIYRIYFPLEYLDRKLFETVLAYKTMGPLRRLLEVCRVTEPEDLPNKKVVLEIKHTVYKLVIRHQVVDHLEVNHGTND